MTKLLLIDDHEIVRIGLKTMFEEAFPGATFGEANNAKEAIQLSTQQDWDLAILELSVDGHGGLDLLKELKKAQPKLPVLVLSMHAEEHYAFRAIRAGAAGYLAKNCSSADLVKAAKHVVKGRRYISASLVETLSAEFQRKGTGAVHELLSDREFQVMRLIGSGKTVGQIAVMLSISDKTVSTYRARILEKTGLRNNAEVVRYVVEKGFGDP